MLNEEAPKIYGLDTIKTEKPIYIVEGPFDSSLIENSVAMCGPILIFGRLVGAIIFGFLIMNHVTEKSLKESTRPLDRGDKVVIWPKFVEEKDINDMVQRGHNVSHVLESNTYSGLEA